MEAPAEIPAPAPGVDQVQTLVMDFSPVAKAMFVETLQPDGVEEKGLHQPLGDEGDGEKIKNNQLDEGEGLPKPPGSDGEKIQKRQPDGIEGEGLPKPSGGKPGSSPTPRGPVQSMSSVFDEEVRQVSKEVMKQNVE